MLFSGYHLGCHLLNSTLVDIGINREEIIKNGKKLKINETYLNYRGESRNSIFIIEGEFNKNDKKIEKCVAKQPKYPDSHYISSIQNENYIYEIFRDFNLNSLNNLMGFDKFQNLLFTKYFDYITPVFDSEPAETFFDKFIPNLSEIFSEFHSINEKYFSENGYPNKFGFRKPLLFNLTNRDFAEFKLEYGQKNRDDVLFILEKNNFEILKIIKSIEWKAENLIHFDFKFEHIILKNENKIETIIDWEMADLGDIHWDLACIWYELILLFINDDDEPSDIVNKTTKYLVSFLVNYVIEYETTKIQKFLSIVLFHKHYYGLFSNVGLSEASVEKWLYFAKLLIKNPNINIAKYISKKHIEHKISPVEEKETKPIDGCPSLNELSGIISSKFQNEKPKSERELSEEIYQWYNSTKDASLKTKLVNETLNIANRQQRGNEIFNENNWWQIEGKSKNNNVVIRKGSERRIAEPGVFIFQKTQKQRNSKYLNQKSYVKLIYPEYIIRQNDANPDSDDLWILSKNQTRQDYSNWIRFYFHLESKTEGINLFINKITDLLNGRSIPFQLKLRNKLSSYYRTDVAILFVHRLHFRISLDIILYVRELLHENEFLREDTPKFTRKIIINRKPLLGLGFAENPVDSSESFGNWRAKLMSKIILDNWKKNQTLEEVNLYLLKELAKLGFNTREMYRNPFPSSTEFKYDTAFLDGNFDENFKIKFESNMDGFVQYMPSSRFLKAARFFAFNVCKEALWYGNYCTWIAFKKDDYDENYYFEAISEDEKLGIALFLSGIYKIFPNETIFKKFYSAILHSYNNLSDYDCILKYIIDNEIDIKIEINDFSDYNLGDWDLNKIESKSEIIGDQLIEKYINKNYPFPNGYSENSEIELDSEFNPTLKHGISGLGYFFLMLAYNKSETRIHSIDSIIKQFKN